MVLVERAWKRSLYDHSEYAKRPGECKISIIGIGGCGNNTVNRIMATGIEYVDCIAVNTDIQHLSYTHADQKILIGENITKGYGAGSRPEVGAEAFLESASLIDPVIEDKDIIFIAAGLGGGTGTGAAPYLAELAREKEALVIGVVTLPFRHEKGRYKNALKGLNDLRRAAHTTVIIDNNRLMDYGRGLPIDTAFNVADTVLGEIVKGIVDTITMPSLINLDLADFKSVINRGGAAIVGMGEAQGNNRAIRSAKKALEHMLIDVDYKGADGALIHISGGEDMTLGEAVQAAETVTDMLDNEALVIWGSRVQPNLGDKMQVTCILTGIRSPHLVGGYDLEEIKLYDLEPFSGPDAKLEIDFGLYKMEKDLRT